MENKLPTCYHRNKGEVENIYSSNIDDIIFTSTPSFTFSAPLSTLKHFCRGVRSAFVYLLIIWFMEHKSHSIYCPIMY